GLLGRLRRRPLCTRPLRWPVRTLRRVRSEPRQLRRRLAPLLHGVVEGPEPHSSPDRRVRQRQRPDRPQRRYLWVPAAGEAVETVWGSESADLRGPAGWKARTTFLGLT